MMPPDESSSPDLAPDPDFFELSLDHICVAGFDGYWKRLNPAWTATLGWTPAEMMSRPLIEFMHPDDRPATLAARVDLKKGKPLSTIYNRYRCKDGSYRWFGWRSVALVERQLIYAVARDVTAEKEAEQELKALAERLESTLEAEREGKEIQRRLQRQLMVADRMASVGTLAAGTAHEINNPLAYLTVNLELVTEALGALDADEAPPGVAEWIEQLDEALQGAERIREIVSGLYTFSRADEAERREVVDVVPILEVALRMAGNEIKHRARLVEDFGPIPHVHADKSRLGQVFLNLLVNAAQAIPDGDADTHELRVSTFTGDDGAAVIEVSDTGAGIPEDALDRLFDPFFTTKPVGFGTGLGLSICHNVVTALGGRIIAQNRAGGGALFRVSLPPAARASVEAARAKSAPPPDVDPPRKAAVLAVDDEPAICVSLRRVLREHEVTTVTSAKEALELVSSGERYDIILSDLMMPEMSGMELYETILGCRPELAERIVFITGGAFTPAARAFLEQIPNRWLQKPFDASQIRTLVAESVRAP